MIFPLVVLLLFCLSTASLSAPASNTVARYNSTWASLDTRPLPSWYDEVKVGIFIVGGVFSVPAWGDSKSGGGSSGEWFQSDWQISKKQPYVDFMTANYPPDFTYADFAPSLTYDLFNATEWAQLFAMSGAKYTAFLTKHHDGYALWPSDQHFNWNTVDVGPHRDITGEISAAIKAAGLHLGLYHSLFEWLNPLYLEDAASNFTTQHFVPNTMSELKDLVNRYEPELIWSDGDWDGPDSYWNAPGNFLAWLVNDSPVKDTVVFNDRWGKGDTCVHGSFWTCSDRFHPSSLQGRKWENAMTLDYHSWGYRRNARISDYMPFSELVNQLSTTIAFGGNLLINVGPAADGSIPPIMEERLLSLGAWLSVNGEGVYNTTPWRAQNQSSVNIYYVASTKTPSIYAHLMTWPKNNSVYLNDPVAGNTMTAQLIAANGNDLTVTIQGTSGTAGVQLQLPTYFPDLCGTGSDVAWVIRLNGIT